MGYANSCSNQSSQNYIQVDVISTTVDAYNIIVDVIIVIYYTAELTHRRVIQSCCLNRSIVLYFDVL